MLKDQLMYLPLKFPNSILIKILEKFHKNFLSSQFLKNSDDIFSTFDIGKNKWLHNSSINLFPTGILIEMLKEFQNYLLYLPLKGVFSKPSGNLILGPDFCFSS